MPGSSDKSLTKRSRCTTRQHGGTMPTLDPRQRWLSETAALQVFLFLFGQDIILLYSAFLALPQILLKLSDNDLRTLTGERTMRLYFCANPEKWAGKTFICNRTTTTNRSTLLRGAKDSMNNEPTEDCTPASISQPIPLLEAGRVCSVHFDSGRMQHHWRSF